MRTYSKRFTVSISVEGLDLKAIRKFVRAQAKNLVKVAGIVTFAFTIHTQHAHTEKDAAREKSAPPIVFVTVVQSVSK